MVLDNGRIVSQIHLTPYMPTDWSMSQAEFGKPSDLLKDEKGLLRSLVNESEDKEKLYELAGVQ